MIKSLVLILVSSLTITAEAQNTPAQVKCTDKVASAVGALDSESVPAYIEACFDAKMLKAVNACRSSECVLNAVDFEDGSEN